MGLEQVVDSALKRASSEVSLIGLLVHEPFYVNFCHCRFEAAHGCLLRVVPNYVVAMQIPLAVLGGKP